MKEFNKKRIMEDYKSFCNSLPQECALELEYFHPFHCPVVIVEAMVEEKSLQDYSVFSLLILRLIHAGFGRLDLIESISGMSSETVNVFINRAIVDRQCKFVDSENGAGLLELTPLGLQTLAENEETAETEKETNVLSPQAHVMYNTPRQMQIDAVPGTVIPAYMELRGNALANCISDKPVDLIGDMILPRESVAWDEELEKEINARIREYIERDYIKSGDVIQTIFNVTAIQNFFRQAYLVKFHGMRYPMIVMTGRLNVSDLNAKSKLAGKQGFAILPLSISESDSRFLSENSLEFPSVLVRDDSCFWYLANSVSGFEMSVPAEEAVEETPEEATVEDIVDISSAEGEGE